MRATLGRLEPAHRGRDHPRRYCYPRQAPWNAGLKGLPDLMTPKATWASLRIMAPMISLGGLPWVTRRCRKRWPHAVLYRVTMAGMYKPRRRKAWPILDKRGLPRTLLPDSCRRGLKPAKATNWRADWNRSPLTP